MIDKAILKRMDEAALIAAKEWTKVPVEVRTQVQEWLSKHYMQAGYKRLSKVILGTFTPSEEP
jgi:hypothetical protein